MNTKILTVRPRVPCFSLELKKTQNIAEKTRKEDVELAHITPALRELHWLPVKFE